MAMIQHRLAAGVAVAVALTAAGDARAAEATRGALLEPRQVTAQRATGPIRVDGVLDEPAWAAAPVAERFLQQRPAPGEPSRLHTSFRVVFDDAALYVGVRLDDPAAWAIHAPIGWRDDENASDWCFVEIDSRRDRRTAFSLGRVAAPTAAAIARVVREADAGNAQLGMFASGLHRAVDGALADQLPRDAGALGIDGRIRWDDQRYEARGWALATDQLGSAAAIARLAAAPWHNLGRVDAPRLRLPDGATRLSGIAGEARLARVGGALQWNLAARAISPGFDVNGLGFQRNSDWLLPAGQWSYDRYLRTSWLNRWQIGSDNAGVGWSWGGERRAAVIDGFLYLVFANYWDATLTVQHELSALSTEWLRGGTPPGDR